jgi:predicted dehydrogenase
MNQPLRIGLIGAGMVSRHHLIAWASLSDQARVVAVADPSSENAARRASEFGISQTYSGCSRL